VVLTDNAELRCKTTKDKKQKTKTKIKDNHHPIVTLPIDTKGRKLNEGRMKGQMKIENRSNSRHRDQKKSLNAQK